MMKLTAIRSGAVFLFCCAAILGAWLAGATPSGWTFTLAAWLSVVAAVMVTWWEP